eukprot:SAG31_NODE_912_length_11066_cov_4.092186_4_plen_138_part_00
MVHFTKPQTTLMHYDFPFCVLCVVRLCFAWFGRALLRVSGNVSKGFAFMSFDSIESAKQAVADSPVHAVSHACSQVPSVTQIIAVGLSGVQPVLNKRTLNVRFKLYAIYLSSTLCASFEAPMPDDVNDRCRGIWCMI